MDQALQCLQLQFTGSLIFLSEDKVDHFLWFITSDMISQDTAYGTSKVKLESGVELVIPKPVRKLIPTRIITQYLTICDESGFRPASTRTLLRLLEVFPASTRKSLQVLDNYTRTDQRHSKI